MRFWKFEILEKCPGTIFQNATNTVLKMPAPGASNSRKKRGLKNHMFLHFQISLSSHSHDFFDINGTIDLEK